MSFKSFNKKGKGKPSDKKGFAEALENAKGKAKGGKPEGRPNPFAEENDEGEAPKKKVKLKFKK